MASLFQCYISIEKEILKKIREITHPICAACRKRCCEEKMCRESIESPFLRHLVDLQHLQYDCQKGWIGRDGCRLNYGRPPVCHEFFCNRILADEKFRKADIQPLLKAFISAGNRAHGNAHLICVPDLRVISSRKLLKLRSKMELLELKLNGLSMKI